MRPALGLVAILLGACGFEHGHLTGGTTSDGGDAPIGADADAPAANPWLTGFLYRKPITITTPTLSAELTDFPVGIVEGADPELGDNARADGLDIIFTSDDAMTRLDHELVKFDGLTGALEAWVHMPTLKNGTTRIYMYYGAAAQTPSLPAAVWATPFAGVWHLESPAVDSTVHAHNATAIGSSTTVPGLGRGIAGGARTYDGGDTMNFGSPSDGSFDPGTTSFSVSLWVNVTTSSNNFDVAMHKGGLNNTDGGFAFFLGTGNWTVHMADGTSARDAQLGTDVHDQWVYLVGVIDRTAAQLIGYRDGVATPTSAAGLGAVTEGAGFFTGGGNTTQPYTGRIDEVRVMSGVRSADWIATEFANLASSTFITINTQQMKP
ncbi:MAG TPA: LamG-like jellyroll fold domain-containing protein [Kofleriaceae bacterium]|jgi:hypothetical protein|nr:LamG-like jellyroll fold domain-containing protein [Kofleriaceae bacterium]